MKTSHLIDDLLVFGKFSLALSFAIMIFYFTYKLSEIIFKSKILQGLIKVLYFPFIVLVLIFIFKVSILINDVIPVYLGNIFGVLGIICVAAYLFFTIQGFIEDSLKDRTIVHPDRFSVLLFKNIVYFIFILFNLLLYINDLLQLRVAFLSILLMIAVFLVKLPEVIKNKMKKICSKLNYETRYFITRILLIIDFILLLLLFGFFNR